MGGHLGHGDHKAIEFKTLVGRRKSANKTSILYIRRADFRLLRKLGSKVPGENTFECAEVHQFWSLFKQCLLKAQDQAIPKCWKPSG